VIVVRLSTADGGGNDDDDDGMMTLAVAFHLALFPLSLLFPGFRRRVECILAPSFIEVDG
jgi:hypothetical protein